MTDTALRAATGVAAARENIAFADYKRVAEQTIGIARELDAFYAGNHPGDRRFARALDSFQAFLENPNRAAFDGVKAEEAAVRELFIEAVGRKSGSGVAVDPWQPFSSTEKADERAAWTVLNVMGMARLPFAEGGRAVVTMNGAELQTRPGFVRRLADESIKAAGKAEDARTLSETRRGV